MRPNPFINCPDCQRLHTRAGISGNTVCSCGRTLWPLIGSQTRPYVPGRG